MGCVSLLILTLPAQAIFLSLLSSCEGITDTGSWFLCSPVAPRAWLITKPLLELSLYLNSVYCTLPSPPEPGSPCILTASFLLILDPFWSDFSVSPCMVPSVAPLLQRGHDLLRSPQKKGDCDLPPPSSWPRPLGLPLSSTLGVATLSCQQSYVYGNSWLETVLGVGQTCDYPPQPAACGLHGSQRDWARSSGLSEDVLVGSTQLWRAQPGHTLLPTSKEFNVSNGNRVWTTNVI